MSWSLSIISRIVFLIKYFFKIRQKIKNAEKYNAIIVGAGASGLQAGASLDKAGFKNWKIIERAAGVGGVWFNSKYPGVACDIESHLYSMSTFLDSSWVHTQSPGAEIKNYFLKMATAFNLLNRIQFNSEVMSAIWQETTKTWKVTLNNSEVLEANFLITATGFHSKPNRPIFPGEDNFSGNIVHSFDWDDSIEYKGKNVAVIGTGSSSLQIVPALQKDVKSLKVFQRTPNWVVTNNELTYSKQFQWFCKNIPGFMKLYRYYNFIYYEILFNIATKYRDGTYTKAYYIMKGMVERSMRNTLGDKKLEEKLIPKHELPDKRPGFSPSHCYLKAFKQENVELIMDGIEEFTEHGILTKSAAEVKVDLIILATGYDVFNSTVNPFKTIGKNAVDLVDHWRDSPTALYGCTTDKFPNFFKLYGPNTSGSLLQTPVFWTIECCVNYIVECLKVTCEKNKQEIMVKNSVVIAYNAWLQKRFSEIFYCKNVTSYYLTKKGENFMLFADCGSVFWWQSLICDINHYVLK